MVEKIRCLYNLICRQFSFLTDERSLVFISAAVLVYLSLWRRKQNNDFIVKKGKGKTEPQFEANQLVIVLIALISFFFELIFISCLLETSVDEIFIIKLIHPNRLRKD